MNRINIAIFVSGSGTNCENLIKYFADSERVNCALVVSNKADAYGLVRATNLGIPTAVAPKPELNDPEVMMPLLQQYDIQFIVLAGFLPLVPNFLIEAFPRRIINIHPALLPKYGGKGMWGHHVHEAVKAAGERETGMTVHFVTPVCDSGRHCREGARAGDGALPQGGGTGHQRDLLLLKKHKRRHSVFNRCRFLASNH